MKKLILILSAMIISSVIFTGCGNSNSDKSSKTNEPSTTTKDSAIVSSAIENDNNYTSNAPVSFDEISGIYLSNENYVQDDLRGDEEQSRDPLPNIPFQKIRLNGPTNIITNAFKQMMVDVKPNGKPYIQGKIKDISQIIVTDKEVYKGIIHIHDLMKEGII